MLKPLFTTLLILVAFIVPDSASAAVTPRFAIEPGVRAANATFQRAPVVPTTKKYVFAHHMVGLTFRYTPTDWLNDINLAYAAGIDGFALNMGVDSWQPDRLKDAYAAALRSGTGFKLFLSLDMNSLPCATAAHAAYLRNLISTFANHPNQFKYSLVGAQKTFVSTFAGQQCTLGQASFADGWRTLKQQLGSSGYPIFFVPSFFVDPNQLSQFDFIDGDFHWNAGWPIQLNGVGVTTDAQRATNKAAVGSFSPDNEHIQSLSRAPGSKAYMAPVSPWFFTHYGRDTYNKNFVYLSDFHLYPVRWEQVIQNRAKVNFVEVITWNDFGESHYIGPYVNREQPGSQAWVNGFPHEAWLDMTRYYSAWYKAGAAPAVSDKIYLWARPHTRDATARNDPIGRPSNYQLFTDALWVQVTATAASNVTITTSPSTSTTFLVPQGITRKQIALKPGDTMKASMIRSGRTVASIAVPASQFTFTDRPATYNFNAFVTASGASTTSAQLSNANGNSAPVLPLIGEEGTQATPQSGWNPLLGLINGLLRGGA